MTLEMDGNGPAPIGRRLAEWRTRRGITAAELAVQSSLPEQMISDLESGRDWVDQHHILASLAAGLQLEPAELTGQPYGPSGTDHATVHATAWHLRRQLAIVASRGAVAIEPTESELAGQTEAVRQAEAAGDDHALALALPALLDLTTSSAARGAEAVRAARTTAYVAGSGLLRRLGYRDLAWSLLQQAEVADPGEDHVLVEEVRLLVSMGLAEQAIIRAERFRGARPSVELTCATGLAHAVARQEEKAARLLEEAASRAADVPGTTEVAVTRAAFALESRSLEELLALEVSDSPVAPAGKRAALLLFSAAAWARRGDTGRAAERLAAAEGAAPLYLRLEPLARELLHVLTARSSTAASGALLARVAEQLGAQ
ncbi:helix-turn-helix domain-containing protein [Streptomyces yangpuensis]|uniref:helix-turn-helix domain-containing protein n=1 Tax=Streptomyces yangpuensis TaxID=1648182 RepID=UPI003800D458